MLSSAPEVRTAARAGNPLVATEDRFRVLRRKGLIIVLDGVTTVALGADALGGTYADVLADAIADLAADLTTDLRTAPAAAIARTAVELGLGTETVPGRSPQATVAVCRFNGDLAEAAVIGDSPVIAIGTDGIACVLADNRLGVLVKDWPDRVEQWGRLGSGEGKIGDERHKELMRAIMRDLRDEVNRPGGYWIAGADPRAGHEAIVETWRLADLKTLVIATDGTSAGVDRYGLMTWPDVDALCRAEGPAASLELVEKAEAGDPLGHQWPRAKPSDDKVLIHVAC